MRDASSAKRANAIFRAQPRSMISSIFGSEQESNGSCILGRFLEDDEFRFDCCHTLRLEEQVRRFLKPRPRRSSALMLPFTASTTPNGTLVRR